MSRIVRRSLAMVKNLPSLEIALELAGPQAMARRLFAWFRDVNNRNQDSATHDSLLRRLKEISLQVVADCDEIPTGRLNLVFELFEIRDSRGHHDAAFGNSTSQDVHGNRRAIHGGDVPPLFRDPHRFPASSPGYAHHPSPLPLSSLFPPNKPTH